MMYMYSRVLNNSTGAGDCTGEGANSNFTVQNQRRRYTFKINNCAGLTLTEEKSATRKERRINQCEWVKILENAEFISVNP